MRYVGEPLTRRAAVTGFGKACRFNSNVGFQYRSWIMVERGGGGDVGLAALMGSRKRAEFGVMILAEWQGRGVAQEVVPQLVDYAFEKCEVEEVFTRHLPGNRAGAAVMHKLRFEPTQEDNGADWLGWRQDRTQWLAMRVMPSALD
jgi:RimJ/RimL family protein N-acetyltransferase